MRKVPAVDRGATCFRTVKGLEEARRVPFISLLRSSTGVDRRCDMWAMRQGGEKKRERGRASTKSTIRTLLRKPHHSLCNSLSLPFQEAPLPYETATVSPPKKKGGGLKLTDNDLLQRGTGFMLLKLVHVLVKDLDCIFAGHSSHLHRCQGLVTIQQGLALTAQTHAYAHIHARTWGDMREGTVDRMSPKTAKHILKASHSQLQTNATQDPEGELQETATDK